MKNNRHLNSLELKLAELHENFGNCIISEDESCEQYYIESDTDSWTTDSKAELMETIIYDLNEWFNDSYPTDTMNGNTLESVGDYLPLFLALPNDCTVLAVGNGAVAAPSTTTAMFHESYDGFKICAIYDYEQHEDGNDIKADLEELFPSTPPQWFVTFKFSNSDYDYIVRVEAEDRTEAIPKAVETFNKECSWHYMPWKSIDIKPMNEETAEPETAEAKKPILCNYAEAIAFTGHKLRTAIQDVLNAVGDCYEITEEVSDRQNTELDTATNHIIYAVTDTIAEYLDF